MGVTPKATLLLRAVTIPDQDGCKMICGRIRFEKGEDRSDHCQKVGHVVNF